MFGGQKNTFGTPTQTPAFSSFNPQQQNTGFGQSAFSKPGGTFGAPTFGQQNNSVFGAQQAPGTSLFGATNPPQQQSFGGEY